MDSQARGIKWAKANQHSDTKLAGNYRRPKVLGVFFADSNNVGEKGETETLNHTDAKIPLHPPHKF